MTRNVFEEQQLAQSVPYKALGQQFHCMTHHGTNQLHPGIITVSFTGTGRYRKSSELFYSYPFFTQFMINFS